MKKFNYYSVLTLLFAVLFFSACSKKEDDVKPTDLRAQIEGTYNYKVKFYVENNGQLAYLGSSQDVVGTMIAKKNTTDSNIIDFMEGGELSFQANKLAQASNGTSFDVPSQNFELDGESYTAVGYNGVQLGSSKYHGAYFTADKKVNAYLEIEGYNLVMFLEGTKQ